MINDKISDRWILLIKEKETLLFTSIFTILAAIRVWLMAGIPKLLIYGPHDDLYFAKAAHFIIHG